MLSVINNGILLRAYRKKAGMTLRAAEKIAGIDHSLIGKFESAERKPSREALVKLGQAYQLTRDQLIELISLFDYVPKNFTDSFKLKRREVTYVMNKPEPTAQDMNFNVDPARTPVLYADSIYIKSNENGVGLDFAQQIGPSNQFNIVARIGLSKEHARRLIDQLEGLLRADGISSTQKKLN